MRYELADHEWTAIKPMLPNKPRGLARVNGVSSRASFGCCGPVRLGGTCQRSSVHRAPATVASFAGGGRARLEQDYERAGWRPMTLPCR
jgi:transposase